jgi:hypothetical protein
LKKGLLFRGERIEKETCLKVSCGRFGNPAHFLEFQDPFPVCLKRGSVRLSKVIKQVSCTEVKIRCERTALEFRKEIMELVDRTSETVGLPEGEEEGGPDRQEKRDPSAEQDGGKKDLPCVPEPEVNAVKAPPELLIREKIEKTAKEEGSPHPYGTDFQEEWPLRAKIDPVLFSSEYFQWTLPETGISAHDATDYRSF